ncbi:MAG: mechanosensitive ion channel family protein [Gammaproteobacteria bacterium]
METIIVDTLQKTLINIFTGFISHIPYFVAAFFMLVVTWLANYGINFLFKRILKRSHLRLSLQHLLLRLISIAVWIVGLLIAAMIVLPGLTPAKALGALGLMSIAIGLAFKDIFENFFAGILILWRFPIEIGDFIECEGIMGQVEEVTIRMTNIRKTTGELIVVPNSFLFKNPVQILTSLNKRRASFVTGIAYGEAIEPAIEVITNAVSHCQTVHDQEPIRVYAQSFGESSIDIEVTWWTDPEPGNIRKSRNEVITAVKRALDDANIEIPFPYRTLTFKEPLEAKIIRSDEEQNR